MDQIPLWCDVCNQQFTGSIPARQHFESQKHKKKAQNSVQLQQSSTYCQVCNIHCDTIQILRNHEASPRHHSMVEKRNQMSDGFGVKTGTRLDDTARDVDNHNAQGHKEYVFNGSRGYCYLCSLELTSESHATSHLNGKNHAKKKHQKEMRDGHVNSIERCVSTHDVSEGMTSTEYCDICRVPFTGVENARQHYASDKHKKKLAQTYFSPVNNDEVLSCDLCQVQFTSADNKRDHMASAKHRKRVELKRKEESGNLLPLVCEVCDCSFTGQENAETHFTSEKHKRNEQNRVIQQRITNCLTTDKEQNLVVNLPKLQPTSKLHGDIDTNHECSNLQDINVYSPIRDDEVNSLGRQESEEFTDTFLAKPINDEESSMESFEENFIAKPVSLVNNVPRTSTGGLSQIGNITTNQVRHVDDEGNANNQIQPSNMQADNETQSIHPEVLRMGTTNNVNDFNDDFESMGERKIREETQTSLRPSLLDMLTWSGSPSAISDSGTIIDEGPPRYIQNNLQLGFMGRGRGILKISNLASEKKPTGLLKPGSIAHNDSRSHDQHCVQEQDNLHHNRVNEDDETKLKRFMSNIKIQDNCEFEDYEEDNEIEKEPGIHEKYQVLQYAAKPKTYDEDRIELSRQNNSQCNDKPADDDIKVQQQDTKAAQFVNRTIYNDAAKDTFLHNEHNQVLNNTVSPRVLGGAGRRASTDSNISGTTSEGSMKGPSSGGSWKGSGDTQDEYRFSETSERGWCYVCNIELTSRNHMRQHTLGQKHMKASQVWRAGSRSAGSMMPVPGATYRCDICNVTFSGPEPRNQHLNSQKHLKKLSQVQTNGVDFYCDICKVQCSGEVSYQQHLAGSQHLKMSGSTLAAGHTLAMGHTGLDRTQWFDCEVCKCRLNTRQQLEIHKKSPRHLAKAQKQHQNFGMDIVNNIISESNQMATFNGHYAEENYNSLNGQQSLLEKFLSEPLFPDEYLNDDTGDCSPNEDAAVVKTPVKLEISDDPVPVFKRFASQTDVTPGYSDHAETPSGTGNGRTARGSELAYATRSRALASGDGKDRSDAKVSSQSQTNRQGSGDAKVNEEVVNPYAKTHPFYCRSCRVPMNTQESYEAHIKGKRHIAKVSKEKAPDRQHLESRRCNSSDVPKIKTVPRNYQIELYKKALANDTLCFLPTGTGKTLVSVLTLCHMLEEFPSKNVLFLVDKVLLVLQQSKYIKEQIDGKQFIRYDPDSVDYCELTRRPLNVAAVCMGQQSTSGIPMWKHDVVVVTAAFCKNLLDQGIVRWTDFSLVVFDEAHHCEKSHPFNILLQQYHSQVRTYEHRPKILGLTASPAGKSDLPKTIEMLRKLLTNMGHVVMNIVEIQENCDTLHAIQSNAEMIVKVQTSQGDSTQPEIEVIRQVLVVYIVDCLTLLCHVSDIEFCVNLDWMKGDSRQISYVEFESNIDSIQAGLGMLSSDKMDKIQFSLFTQHVQCLCMAYNSLVEGGVLCAVEEINNMETTDAGFKFAKGIGLPCDDLYMAIMNQGQNMLSGCNTGSDMSHKTGSHVQSLLRELIAANDGNPSTDRKSISLVLVKQRGTAHKLTSILNSSTEMQRRGIRTALVVGHGAGGAPDKGMSVNQQKRTLEDVKQGLYRVVIATSVAEEGVDWPDCDCVISMYPPSTVTALVQMRGRARKKHSKFVILCESEAEQDKLADIMRREKNMIEATRVIVEQQNTR